MAQEILELARTLGQVPAEREEALSALCQAAEQELRSWLREDAAPEDCGEAFPVAGAWLALAGLEMTGEVGQAESFTAGDLTIRHGDGAARADRLRRQARALMAPWLADRSFLFYGVNGL